MSKKIIVLNIISSILLYITLLIAFAIPWSSGIFELLNLDNIIYNMKGQTNISFTSEIASKVVKPATILFVIMMILYFCVWYLLRNKAKVQRLYIFTTKILLLGLCAFESIFLWQLLDVSKYIKNHTQYSNFIEENYIDSKQVKLSFPEKKRNLIYIYLESMESSYMDIQII